MMSSCSTPHTVAAGSLRATSGRSPCRSTSPSNTSAPIRTSWNSVTPTAELRHPSRHRSTADLLPCKLQLLIERQELVFRSAALQSGNGGLDLSDPRHEVTFILV